MVLSAATTGCARDAIRPRGLFQVEDRQHCERRLEPHERLCIHIGLAAGLRYALVEHQPFVLVL